MNITNESFTYDCQKKDCQQQYAVLIPHVIFQ